MQNGESGVHKIWLTGLLRGFYLISIWIRCEQCALGGIGPLAGQADMERKQNFGEWQFHAASLEEKCPFHKIIATILPELC